MSDGKKEDVQTVTVEQFNELKAQFENQSKKIDELTKVNATLTEDNTKLKKIFDERQTKSLEHVLKELGFEKKDPEKSDKEVITERFKELETKLQALETENAEKDKRIALNDKKAKVTELAKKFNFIDTSDVLNAIDYDNEDFEGQIKTLAETKKHWISPKQAGGNFQEFNDDKGGTDAFLEGFESD